MSKLLSVLIATVFAASVSSNVGAADASPVEAEKAGATKMKKEAQADRKAVKELEAHKGNEER